MGYPPQGRGQPDTTEQLHLLNYGSPRILLNKGPPHFHLAQGPTNNVAGPVLRENFSDF